MRTAIAGLVLLLTTAATARGDADAESVDVIVPSGAVTGSLDSQSTEKSHLGWKRITVTVDGSVGRTLDRLQQDLGTEVYLDRRLPLLGGEAEPHFDRQWGLENTGQEGGTADADIDIRGAWSTTTGDGVVVAVVDSGVDRNGADLGNQIWSNQDETINGVDDDGNGFIDDVDGWDFEDGDNDPSPGAPTADEAHATMVAGIIAADVNGSAIAGVAPAAEIMNLRACSQGDCFTFLAVAAIQYAVDNGADIINLSFGGAIREEDLDDVAPLEDAIEYARRNDVLVITAAGNTPPSQLEDGWLIVPAEFPHSNNMAVAATDRQDRMWSASFYGDTIDIAAPGHEILSTSVPSLAVGSGTSFAAPHVAGVAALIESLDTNASYREVAARLKQSVDRPAGVAGKVESGRLNAAQAVPPFFDILGHTFEHDIEWAADVGVTKGCNPPANTFFCPDNSVTRGQMAAFIRRHLKLPSPSRDHFGDDNGSTFEHDINRLAEAGITKGCNPPTNDEFCPDDPVTREQMAAFLARAFELSQVDNHGFEDVSSSNTFVNDIAKLASADITRGCNPPSNTRYCPQDEVTRGQMTAFLNRADG